MHILISGLLISCFIHTHAMDSSQQPLTWVMTNDNHLTPISKHIAAQSALLTILTENGKISHAHPLPINVNKKKLDFFCEKQESTPLPAQKLIYNITLDQYCALIDVADKLRTQTFYTELIDEILPQDIKVLLMPQHIKDACRNNIITNNYTHNELISNKQQYGNTQTIIISNDGRHCITDIRNINLTLSNLASYSLWNTQTCSFVTKILSACPLYQILFSPDGTYVIVRGHPNIVVYNITENKEYPLIFPKYFNVVRDIIISPDSKHILISGVRNNKKTVRHALWSLDKYAIPQPIILSSPYWKEIYAATFHPDNAHIIYHARRRTLQTCPIASPNDITPQEQNEKLFAANDLTVVSDSTHIIAANDDRYYNGYGQVIFNIENLNNITCTEIPRQALSNECYHYIPRLYISHKKLLTQIANNATTLKLLDTNTCSSIASYTASNKAIITTLAVDTTGNYLASGYNDGSIIIWDLSNITKHIRGKKIITTCGIIKSLIFGDNQLLLSYGIADNPQQHGSIILWDVHGHKILDFGTTATSIMSKNGNCIITACERRQMINPRSNVYNSFVTLTAWNVYNKKIIKKFNDILETLTLSQTFAFYAQYQQEQAKK